MRSTKSSCVMIYLLFASFVVCLSATNPSDSSIVKLLSSTKKEYVFTKHHIAERKNNKFIFLSSVENEIRDAVECRDTIWIGTVEGLYTYSPKRGVLQRSTFVPGNLNISKLKTDAEGSLWIASINDGLWRLKEGKAEKFLNVSPVYSLEISNDSVVWAGSNIGLYKLNRKATSWQRYAEEGYSGYEIPDNIVENLFCDLHNNIWVIMPDEFALIRATDYNGHIHGFRNMATQDFELKFIAELSTYQYIFVTSKGIFLMPDLPADQGHEEHEIKESPEQKMYLLSNEQLLLNKDFDPKNINTVSTDKKGNLLLSCWGKVYCIKKKTIKNIVTNTRKR